LLSGLIASQVLYEGQTVMAFRMEAAGLVCAMVLFVLGPLVMFTRQLDRAKREGADEWGRLAASNVFAFQEKWTRGDGQAAARLLGTSDAQSLANLSGGYRVACDMRLVPFGKDDVLRLAAATFAPLLPLGLTMFSLQELMTRLVKILF